MGADFRAIGEFCEQHLRMVEREFEAKFERDLEPSRVVSFQWQRMVVFQSRVLHHENTNKELWCEIGANIPSIGSLRTCSLQVSNTNMKQLSEHSLFVKWRMKESEASRLFRRPRI